MIFLLGGARSGKSHLAVSMASRSSAPVRLIATARADDEEMTRRIEAHRESRPEEWAVVEEPIDIERAMVGAFEDETVVVDCVTLWISNLLADNDDEAILEMIDAAVLACVDRSARTIVVSNEVGAGIVPAAPLARRFRDLQGRANQRFAAAAEISYLVVAGKALRLEGVDDDG